MTIPQDRKLWIGGGVISAIVLIAASWFLAIHPKLSDASSLNAQADTSRTQNLSLQSKATKLKQKNDNLAALQAQVDAAEAQLPTGSGLPDLTRQLNAQAISTGVTLNSINVGGTSSGSTTAGHASSGAVAIPMTLTTEGLAAHQYAFLKTIQQVGPRLMLIGATQMSPGNGATTGSIDSVTKLTVQLTVFALPS